jgi:hypothetical protein
MGHGLREQKVTVKKKSPNKKQASAYRARRTTNKANADACMHDVGFGVSFFLFFSLFKTDR